MLARSAGSRPSRSPRTHPARPGPDGTPEQIHLTWGDDPGTSMVVSWASPGAAGRPPGRAVRPRVRMGQRVTAAEPRPYAGRRGETVWTYHAPIGGLRPGATYAYL